MSNEQIQEQQDHIARLRKDVDLADSLDRLLNNKDFKEVILKGYFEKEAVRLVHVKADPNMQTPERQASVLRDIDAIGTFRGFLDLIGRRGVLARKGIDDAHAEIDMLENEE